MVIKMVNILAMLYKLMISYEIIELNLIFLFIGNLALKFSKETSEKLL